MPRRKPKYPPFVVCPDRGVCEVREVKGSPNLILLPDGDWDGDQVTHFLSAEELVEKVQRGLLIAAASVQDAEGKMAITQRVGPKYPPFVIHPDLGPCEVISGVGQNIGPMLFLVPFELKEIVFYEPDHLMELLAQGDLLAADSWDDVRSKERLVDTIRSWSTEKGVAA